MANPATLTELLTKDIAASGRPEAGSSAPHAYPRRYALFRQDTTTGAMQIEMVINHPELRIVDSAWVSLNNVNYFRVVYEDRLQTLDEMLGSDKDVEKLLCVREVIPLSRSAKQEFSDNDSDPKGQSRPLPAAVNDDKL